MAVPLLKPIVAGDGDFVETTPLGIKVNGLLLPNTAPLPRDSQSRSLEPWQFGIYRVQPGTVWVASTYHRGSYDSRYMRPISTSQIRRRLKPFMDTLSSKISATLSVAASVAIGCLAWLTNTALIPIVLLFPPLTFAQPSRMRAALASLSYYGISQSAGSADLSEIFCVWGQTRGHYGLGSSQQHPCGALDHILGSESQSAVVALASGPSAGYGAPNRHHWMGVATCRGRLYLSGLRVARRPSALARDDCTRTTFREIYGNVGGSFFDRESFLQRPATNRVQLAGGGHTAWQHSRLE